MFVGLSGKIGAGKDTAADEFIKQWHGEVTRLSFALKVKQTVALLTNTTLEDNIDRSKRQTRIEPLDATLGELQQKIGNGLRELIHEDVWVHSVLSDKSPGIKLITDVRYPNEARAIEKSGAAC